MARKPKAKPEAVAEVEVISYKGFNLDWTCTPDNAPPFQYEVGKTYEHDGEVVACRTGFHA